MSPAWNTQGKDARKYSNRLNKMLGANYRVFARLTFNFSRMIEINLELKTEA